MDYYLWHCVYFPDFLWCRLCTVIIWSIESPHRTEDLPCWTRCLLHCEVVLNVLCCCLHAASLDVAIRVKNVTLTAFVYEASLSPASLVERRFAFTMPRCLPSWIPYTTSLFFERAVAFMPPAQCRWLHGRLVLSSVLFLFWTCCCLSRVPAQCRDPLGMSYCLASLSHACWTSRCLYDASLLNGRLWLRRYRLLIFDIISTKGKYKNETSNV